MVMSGRSVHLFTLFFWATLTKQLNPELHAHTFICNLQQTTLLESAEGKRMAVEIIN